MLKVMPQKITLTLRPEPAFEMPYSEGYQLYSPLLGVMREADDAAMARHTHDSPISSISLGPLEGRFRALREGHAQGRRSGGEVRADDGDNRSKGGRDLPLHHCSRWF